MSGSSKDNFNFVFEFFSVLPENNSNLCASLDCKHLCVNVPSENGLVAKCLCGAAYELTDDKKQCHCKYNTKN
jgi:hypothetical protein